jgi:hypothetical protein
MTLAESLVYALGQAAVAQAKIAPFRDRVRILDLGNACMLSASAAAAKRMLGRLGDLEKQLAADGWTEVRS